MATPDKWQPRDHASYTHALLAKLPTGEVWPRHPSSTLVRTVHGLTGIVARWAERVGLFLLREAFPPTSHWTLADWERVLGLPEPCLPIADLTVAERQRHVREKLRRRPGRQDRYYFLERALELGYDVTITEHVPFQCGVTPCGASIKREAVSYTMYWDDGLVVDWDDTADMASLDDRLFVVGAGLGTPLIRYVWRISLGGPRLTWFACGAGGGRTGQDPHLKIRRAEDLECLLDKLKPAHTHLIFTYTGV